MADIKANLKVEGLTTFKSDMKAAKTSITELDAELKLAAAEYEASGDKEKYMADQSEILKKKLDEQKKAVETAENALKTMKEHGVDENSAAWKEWQTKLVNAQTAMTTTQTKLNNLGEDVKDGSTGLKDMASAAGDVDENLKKIASNTDFSATITAIDSVYSSVKGTFGAVKNLASELWKAEADATVWADDLLTTATQYTLDPETLQRWEYAARFVDTSVDAMAKGMSKSGGSWDDFWANIDALHSMTDDTERNAAAMSIFGERLYTQLLPLIEAGSAVWNDTAAGADIVSNEDVAALGKANDALEDLNNTWQNTQMELAAKFAPVFEKIIDGLKWIADNAELVGGAFLTIKGGIAALEVSKNVVTLMETIQKFPNLFGGKSAGEAAEAVAGAAGGAKTNVLKSIGGAVKNGAGKVAEYIPGLGFVAAGLAIGNAVWEGTGEYGRAFMGERANGAAAQDETIAALVSSYIDSGAVITEKSGLMHTDLDDMQEWFEEYGEGMGVTAEDTAVALAEALAAEGVAVDMFATSVESAIAGIMASMGGYTVNDSRGSTLSGGATTNLNMGGVTLASGADIQQLSSVLAAESGRQNAGKGKRIP